jgi:hypothetical protein
MKKILHLVFLLCFLITGMVLSQSRETGVPKHPEEVSIAKNKVENVLYSGDDFYVSNLYPNPADEFIQIDYSIPAHITNLKIEIRNILGNSVTTKPYVLNPENKGIKISTSNLIPGIYFHTLYLDNNALVTRKLIIKR